jgi:vitamin B12 transporter
MRSSFRVLAAPMAVSRFAFAFSFAVSAVCSLPVMAQTQLKTVVVTATREPAPLSRVTSDVVVIDADRIRSSMADSVEDLLRREAGLQITRNGGPGKSGGFFLRGSGTNSTVVLIDGVRIGSATLGQAELDALSLSQVDHIEVLRGPASSLYGADAVGGVVQIFTRRGQAIAQFNAVAMVGGYGSRQVEMAGSGANKGFDYAAALSRETSKGVSALRPGDQFGNYNPDADGFGRGSGTLNLGFTPAGGHRVGLKLVQSRLNTQFDDSEYLAPNFAQDATTDFRSRLVNQVVALDYRGFISPTLTTSLQFAVNKDDSISGASQPQRYLTERKQFTAQTAWKLDNDKQIVALFEHLGESAQADAYLAPVKRSNNAVALGYSGQYGAHSVQADVRRDNSSVYGGVTTGRVGWGMDVGAGWRVRALAGTTFRAPSFNDLYFPDYGVSSIRPEKGRSVEAGVSWRAAASDASVTVYQNKVRDQIGYQPDATFCPAGAGYQYGCAANVSRARLSGATLTASTRTGGLTLRGNVDVLDAKDADTGTRLPRRAAHQESVTADYATGAWTFSAALLAVGSRPDAGVVLSGYETLDLRTTWRVAAQWSLEAKLLNATNRNIEPVRDFQALGRQAWVGVRFDSAGL